MSSSASISDGSASFGTVSDESVSDESVSDGSVSDGSVSEASILDTTTQDPRQPGVIRNDNIRRWIDRWERSQVSVPIGEWNVSGVTDMEWLFTLKDEFNEDISRWDVSNVTSMSSMFDGCSEFNQPIGRWNVSNVTDMADMFVGCDNFLQDLSSWNILKAKSTLEYMFDDEGMERMPKDYMPSVANFQKHKRKLAKELLKNRKDVYTTFSEADASRPIPPDVIAHTASYLTGLPTKEERKFVDKEDVKAYNKLITGRKGGRTKRRKITRRKITRRNITRRNITRRNSKKRKTNRRR
jgi:surface protein